jgi:hypothetical protein
MPDWLPRQVEIKKKALDPNRVVNHLDVQVLLTTLELIELFPFRRELQVKVGDEWSMGGWSSSIGLDQIGVDWD